MHEIRLAVRQIHVRAVAGLLQYGVRVEIAWLEMVGVGTFAGLLGLGGDERSIGIRLVRPPHVARTAHGHGVVVAGAAFGAHEVVPAVAFGQVRGLDAASVGGAAPDALWIAEHVLGFRIVFHAADHARLLVAFARLPFEADDVLPAVVVMQDGRVEAGGGEVDRFAPRPFDALRLDEVVVHVEIAGVHGVHHAVDHVEHVLGFVVGEAWRPDALGARQLGEVRIGVVGEYVGEQLPMLHVLGMVDRDAREPFEGGYGHVVVVAFAADGRIGVEAFEDRIMQHCRSLYIPSYYLRFPAFAGAGDVPLPTRSGPLWPSLYGLQRKIAVPGSLWTRGWATSGWGTSLGRCSARGPMRPSRSIRGC